MIFPSSNLSTAAQPWGRVVEKSIGSLETLVATERVNNAARDAQAVVNIRRLDDSVVGLATQQALTAKNVTDIKTITDNVFVANTTEINGYNIKAGTIDADSINAGTLTGFTVQTSSGSSSVVLRGDANALSIKYSNNYIGNLSVGYNPSLGYGVTLNYGGTLGDLNNSHVYLYNNTAVLSDGTGEISIAGGDITFSGDFSGSGSVFTNQGSFIAGPNAEAVISSSGAITNSGNITTGGSIIRTALISTTTTGASITAGGAIVRTTSSARYKQDIDDITFNYEDILALQPKKFRLRDDVENNENAPYHVGFIAEDLANTPLDVFVNYKNIDGEIVPDGIQYLGMTAMLLDAIKKQDVLIKQLATEIENLKGA